MPVALIGDVGGHCDALARCLDRLGVRGGRWPVDLQVVQVGDLVGGRNDLGVIEMVDDHVRSGRWLPLVGNWELAAIGGPRVSSGGRLVRPEALEVLGDWWRGGLLARAVAVRSPATRRVAVVTHAGVTRAWWCAVGRPASSVEMVEAIEAAPLRSIAGGGEMAGEPGLPPSPCWASVGELWRGWEVVGSPWPQVHGHSTAYDFHRRGWCAWTPPSLTDYARVDRQRRHVRFTPRGSTHQIIGIDPGLGRRGSNDVLSPLVVPDGRVLI